MRYATILNGQKEYIMEESMFQRLITAERRLKEIDDELISEEIMN